MKEANNRRHGGEWYRTISEMELYQELFPALGADGKDG